MQELVSITVQTLILPIIKQGLVYIHVPLNGSFSVHWPPINAFNYVKIINLQMCYIRLALEHVGLPAQMAILLTMKHHVVSKDVLLSNHFIIKISLQVAVFKLVQGKAMLIIQIRLASIVHHQVLDMFQTAQEAILLTEFRNHV